MPDSSPEPSRAGRRGNDLDGAAWTRNSISVWSDIRKTPEEAALKHPAMFPTMLVERVIRCFTCDSQPRILDPFCGSGSTLVAARNLDRFGLGFEVAEEYVRLAHRRMEALGAAPGVDYRLCEESADRIPARLEPESVDLCVTSPPYWNILAQKRSADQKAIRDYHGADDDLSRIDDYPTFVERLAGVLDGIYDTLKPGSYCVVNVMDLRKKDRFFPLHSDLATHASDPARGGRYLFDDLIIWDRRAEYNNLRPLGYPYVFRVNKVHEFLIILRKPRQEPATTSTPRRI
jgi:DNA modification methylase